MQWFYAVTIGAAAGFVAYFPLAVLVLLVTWGVVVLTLVLGDEGRSHSTSYQPTSRSVVMVERRISRDLGDCSIMEVLGQ